MLEYQVGSGRATLTLDEPERLNPLTTETMSELRHAVREASQDDEVRVMVVTGRGERAFSAGGDLASGFVDDALGLHGERLALADLFRGLRSSGKPTVARVNGHALGGGFGLAAVCDIVVAVDDALLGTPEMTVGLWPMMITAVLKSVVPEKALFEMMATGRRISAQEALALGVVTRVVPREALDSAVDQIVDRLMALSPAALEFGKHAFYAVADMDLDAALDHLHIGLTAVAMTDDASEGVAAFVDKRDATWTGR